MNELLFLSFISQLNDWGGWLFLRNINIIIALCTFVITILTFRKVRNQEKLLKKRRTEMQPIRGYNEMFDKFKTIQTDNPGAFCISLLPNLPTGDMKNQVVKYLKLVDLNIKESNVIEKSFNGLEGTTESLQKYIEELNSVRIEVTGKGFSELRLFIAGPVQGGTIAGAVFDNFAIPVLLYHKGREGYEYWGPLLKN